MKSQKSAPRVTAHAAEILKRIGIFQNPYFEQLKTPNNFCYTMLT